MNRRHLIRTLALSALGTTTAFAGSRGGDGGMRVGYSFRYDDELKVTFLAVRKDSRCPLNAQCVSAGDAVVVLRVKAGNQAARNVRIHTNRFPRVVTVPANEFPPGVSGIPKSYVIRIGALSPLPTAGKRTLQADYRLSLDISVAV